MQRLFQQIERKGFAAVENRAQRLIPDAVVARGIQKVMPVPGQAGEPCRRPRKAVRGVFLLPLPDGKTDVD